jgi:hypothetical protein
MELCTKQSYNVQLFPRVVIIQRATRVHYDYFHLVVPRRRRVHPH